METLLLKCVLEHLSHAVTQNDSPASSISTRDINPMLGRNRSPGKQPEDMKDTAKTVSGVSPAPGLAIHMALSQ